MAAKKISQVEARRLKRRVAELEEQKRQNFYGAAVGLVEITLSSWSQGMCQSAQMLGHKLVARLNGDKLTISAIR